MVRQQDGLAGMRSLKPFEQGATCGFVRAQVEALAGMPEQGNSSLAASQPSSCLLKALHPPASSPTFSGMSTSVSLTGWRPHRSFPTSSSTRSTSFNSFIVLSKTRCVCARRTHVDSCRRPWLTIRWRRGINTTRHKPVLSFGRALAHRELVGCAALHCRKAVAGELPHSALSRCTTKLLASVPSVYVRRKVENSRADCATN